MRAVLIGLLAAGAACGAGTVSQRQEAIEATYQTDFATVWNALAASVKEDFPSAIKTEDSTVGYIETKWEAVDFVVDSTVVNPPADQNPRHAVGAPTCSG